jgi:hypothetical protein
VTVAQTGRGLWVHTDAVPNEVAGHDAVPADAADLNPQEPVASPGERSAAALERCANALEVLADQVEHMLERWADPGPTE